MPDKLPAATAEIAALKRQVPALMKSETEAYEVIDFNKFIARVMGRNNLPPDVLYVQDARNTALTCSATAVGGDDDDADYAKYASFEFSIAVQQYPPRFGDPHDATCSQAWAKRAVFTLKYKSGLQEATKLLNAGVWT